MWPLEKLENIAHIICNVGSMCRHLYIPNSSLRDNGKYLFRQQMIKRWIGLPGMLIEARMLDLLKKISNAVLGRWYDW